MLPLHQTLLYLVYPDFGLVAFVSSVALTKAFRAWPGCLCIKRDSD